MKRKLIFFTFISTLLLILLSGCNAREIGSLKSITSPYIASYECTEAYYGEENILNKFDLIEINLVNKKQMELIYKLKGEDKCVIETEYTFDLDTRELSAEIGILGHKFRQTTTVKNGKFTISKSIGAKQLVMKFEAK